MMQAVVERPMITRSAENAIGLYRSDCRGRKPLEDFIAARFLEVHNASLQHFLPLILGMHRLGQPVSAVGLRPGTYDQHPLFIEQYLAQPIETYIDRYATQKVRRNSLVEIGNLAVSRQDYGPMAMTLLAAVLADAGYEWMVFTATAQVERLIRRLGFRPQMVAMASAEQLKSGKLQWGSYYDNCPQVMVGNLHTAAQVIARSRFLSGIVARQQPVIDTIAHSLREYRGPRTAE